MEFRAERLKLHVEDVFPKCLWELSFFSKATCFFSVETILNSCIYPVLFWKEFQSFCCSPNSFSYRGSYFKYRGEGSQIFWIRFGGGCRAGCRPRCRLMCVLVWVRVRRF